MLQYAAEVLDKAPKPAFLALFTLTSHHPYNLPEHFKGKFPKGTQPIYESMGYTDYSLRKFFETAEKKPWFNKTIFVLTADHTHPPIVRNISLPAPQRLPGAALLLYSGFKAKT